MVSFHNHAELETTLSKKRKPIYNDDDENEDDIPYQTIDKSLKAKTSKFQEFGHLHTPLPLEGHPCLQTKSGKSNWFDTKTNESSSRDPIDSSSGMSLDLDLHLPCGSHPKMKNKNDEVGGLMKIKSPSLLSSSCLAFEGDEEKELVTAVCHKCHMLIMMSKASLSCPNCKFIHKPQDNKFHGLSL